MLQYEEPAQTTDNYGQPRSRNCLIQSRSFEHSLQSNHGLRFHSSCDASARSIAAKSLTFGVFFNSDERFGKGSVLNSLQETRKHIPTRGYVENQKIINSKVPLVMDNYVSSQGLLIFNQSWSRSFFEKKTVCKKQKSASIPEKIPICRLFRPFFPKDSSRCSVLHVKSQAALLVSSSSCFSLMRTPKDRSIPITACTSATTKGTKMPSWIYAFCMWACVNLIESRTLVCYGWSLQFIRTYSF